MKSALKPTPREFAVGGVTIRDWGSVQLDASDMLAIKTSAGKNCDVTATEWGLYLGSSVNERMRSDGFRVALVENRSGKRFVNAVELDKLRLFEAYLRQQDSKIVAWLDGNIETQKERS